MPKLFSKDFWFGSPEKVKNYNPYSSGAQNIFAQLEGGLPKSNNMALQWLNQILSNDPEAFAEFEGPALEQFESEIIPQIMERFGGIGAHNSSALHQTLGQAGRSLSRDLAAQRANLKSNAVSGLQNYSQLALQPQNQPYVQGATQGVFGGNVGSAIGTGLGSLLASGGNPLAGLLGGLGGLFSGRR